MTGDWRQHCEDLTVRLAHLVRLGGEADVADLDAALHARRAVVALATDGVFDISGLQRHSPRRWETSEAHSHPVEQLARVLQNHEQPFPRRSLAECLADDEVSSPGQVWRKAATDAVLAHHEWNRLDVLERRLGTEAWTAVHELAQFCHALTWLDAGTAASCLAARRPADAAALSGGALRLRGASRAVMTLASGGPLPVLRRRSGPAPRAALIIRRPEHLHAGLERLTHLLRTADHVSPKHVQAAYRLLTRLSSDACRVLITTDHAKLPTLTTAEGPAAAAGAAEAAVDFSEALHRAGRHPGRVHSLEASDPAVVVQLQLIGTLTAAEPSVAGLDWARGTPGRAREAAFELLQASTSAADALSEVTVRLVEDRRWLVPAGTGGVAALTWVPSWPHQANAFHPDAPPLLKAGVEARRLGAVLGDGLTAATRRPITEVVASHPPASRRLAAALLAAEREAALTSARPEELRLRPSR